MLSLFSKYVSPNSFSNWLNASVLPLSVDLMLMLCSIGLQKPESTVGPFGIFICTFCPLCFFISLVELLLEAFVGSERVKPIVVYTNTLQAS